VTPGPAPATGASIAANEVRGSGEARLTVEPTETLALAALTWSAPGPSGAAGPGGVDSSLGVEAVDDPPAAVGVPGAVEVPGVAEGEEGDFRGVGRDRCRAFSMQRRLAARRAFPLPA